MTKTTNNNNLFFIVFLQMIFLLYYVNLCFNFLRNNVILIISALILFAYIIKDRNKSHNIHFFVGIFCSAFGFVVSILNGSGYGSAVTQTCFILSILVFSEMELTKQEYKKCILSSIIILLLIIIFFSKKWGMYYYPFFKNLNSGDMANESFLLNPNCIAMIIFYLAINLFIFVELFVAKFKGFLQIFFLVICGYLILRTDARTSFFALCLFVFCKIIFKNKNRNFFNKLFIVGLFLSFAFGFVYTTLYNLGFYVDKLFLGKGLYSGREKIWQECLEYFAKSPFIGFSNKTAFGPHKILSTHNSLLAVLSYFGIIGFMLFVYCLIKSFKKIKCISNTVVIAIICSTLIMCFETILTDYSLMWPFCFLFISCPKESRK